MSWACVVAFKEPATEQPTWAELLDSLQIAAAWLAGHPDHVAYEIGDDGEPTGVVMRMDPGAAAFLRGGRRSEDG